MRYTLKELSELEPAAISALRSRGHIRGVIEALIETAKAGLQAVDAEREACAKICDKQQPEYERFEGQRAAGQTARKCAAAIRARGEK